MNTKIVYLYRDEGNWKTYHEIVVSGMLTFDDLQRYFHLGDYFIPSIIGLPNLYDGGVWDDDAVLHEIIECVPTSDEHTTELTSDELLQRFAFASSLDWSLPSENQGVIHS